MYKSKIFFLQILDRNRQLNRSVKLCVIPPPRRRLQDVYSLPSNLTYRHTGRYEGFFAAIVRKPFGVYKEIVKVPEAPGHIFDFHAAQARETEYKAGRAVYEAWQAISGVIS